MTLSSPSHALRSHPYRWIGIGFAVVVVGFLVGRALLGGQTPPAPPTRAGSAPSDEAVSAATMTVHASLEPLIHLAPGTVRPQLEATIATRATGRVIAVLVREGDRVRRGQPLVRLDSRDLDAAIRQAGANLRSASVGYDAARTVADMEASLSAARVAEAQGKVAEAEAGLKAAQARLEQTLNGPRKQERRQASLAVVQAKANLTLAESNLRRYESLLNEGAISRQMYETAQAQVAVARAQHEAAVQAESLTEEGSREEEIRSAREAVRLAEAGLSQARAGLRQAQAAERQVEVRKQEARVAQAQIGQSRAALEIAQVSREYTVITAPFDGVVSARLADPGVLATPATPLLRIQGGPLRLEASVPESVLSAARVGSAVSVQLDAVPGSNFAARVVEIAPQGDPASHTFTVKAELPAESGARAGMFGRLRLTVGQARQILVPAEAVREREGLHYVWVVQDGRAALRLVTVGDRMGESYPVLSGLREGERIVRSGGERVRDGARIAE